MDTPKGYFPALKRTWWLKHRYFMAYMVREATVLPLVFFIACLLAGIYCLYQGADYWQEWQQFMQDPATVAINLLAFIASLFHAATFFTLFPRVMPLRVGGQLLPAKWIVLGQWLAMLLVAVFFTWLFGRGI